MIESIIMGDERTVTIVLKKQIIPEQKQDTFLLLDIEKAAVLRAIREHLTLDDAAKALGINLSTLWRKRRQYGLQQ